MQDERINRIRCLVCAPAAQRRHQSALAFGLCTQRGPLVLKPLRQLRRFGSGFRRLNQVQRVARRQAKAVGAEGKRAQYHLCGSAV